MSSMDQRKLGRQLSRTPSFYDMMKRNNPHDLSQNQLRCALISACLSVPVFVIAMALVLFEHQSCPDGASSNPDDDPLTDDNPNNCKSWYECIDHDSLECVGKAPSAGLLVFYYLLLALSVALCTLFLYCTKCMKSYNECAQFMGTDVFRYFVTVFILFAVVLTLLILGLVFSVEGARSCPPDSWKVSTHKRLYNPNGCSKCVEAADSKRCVEDWDVDASLLEVGIVLIVLCFAIATGGCWYIIFRQKVALSLADEELLGRKLSVSQEAAGKMKMLEPSVEAESPESAPSDHDPMTMPMTAGAGDIELAVVEEKDHKEEPIVISTDRGAEIVEEEDPDDGVEVILEDDDQDRDDEDIMNQMVAEMDWKRWQSVVIGTSAR